MSDSALEARELLHFDGPVRCERPRSAVDLVLIGHTSADTPALALVSGAGNQPLPARLDGARLLLGADSGIGQRLTIEIGAQRTQLNVRAVQIHRDAARAFYRALPGEPITRGTRLGWTLLLWLLRIPGAAGLLMRLRGQA